MRKLYLLLFCLAATLALSAQTTDHAGFSGVFAGSGRVVFTNECYIADTAGKEALWSFGDGTAASTPALAGTQHVYTQAGTYLVKLVIRRSSNGALLVTDSTQRSVLVLGFTGHPDTCGASYWDIHLYTTSPLTRNFQYQPRHNNYRAVTSVTWDFGDGSPVSAGPVGTAFYDGTYAKQHVFATGSAYNVCVTIGYEGGCQAQNCRLLPVLDSSQPMVDTCHANLALQLSSTQVPATASATLSTWHNHQRPVVSVCWYWGDGSPEQCAQGTGAGAPALTATHTYTTPGTYWPYAVVMYEGGCTSYTQLPASIVLGGTAPVPDSCHAGWTATHLPNQPPLARSFAYQEWHNHQRPVVSAVWNWGDNTPPTTTTAVSGYGIAHQYVAAGNYNVCLTLHYEGGCESSNCHVLAVVDSSATPDTCHAAFTQAVLNASPIAQVVGFAAQPSHNHNKAVTRVCWTFGDGRDTCVNYTAAATAWGVHHNYAQPGTYTVCVTIYYDGGCQSSSCHSVALTAVPDSCSANFVTQPATNNRLGKTFIAQDWHNYDRYANKICWTFGDGRDTCILYPNGYVFQSLPHVYPAPGNYNACVTIYYEGGCQSAHCANVNIPVPPPDSCHANLIVQLPAQAAPLQRRFVVTPFHNNYKRVLRINWLFGDGRDTTVLYGPGYTGTYSAEHQYQQTGVYTVCAQVLFDGGCQSSACLPVVIQGVPAGPAPDSICYANFQVNSGQVPGELSFTALTSSLHRAVEICWYFGDGQSTCVAQPDPATLASRTVFHTYSTPGNYMVCVRIRYDNGCTGQKCDNVFVYAPGNCTTTFTHNLLTERLVHFLGGGTIDPGDALLLYTWNFGDGSRAFSREVQHTYLNGGTYQVCLTTRTRGGCESQACDTLQINAANISLLTLVPNPVSTELHVNFTSTGAQGTATLRIITAAGSVVHTETRPCYPGQNAWTLNVSTLPTGFYTLQVQTTTQSVSRGFFKQ